MEIQVELSKLVINESVAQQVIVLKEVDGERFFPIVIGMPEILAIDRRIKGQKFPRPLTHDLIVNAINKLGGSLEKIVITDLDNHTFYANICVRVDGKLVMIDSRPSDALAVSAGMNIPIYVDETVFRKV